MADQPFRDAEAWLAERGIHRERIQVPPTPPEQTDGAVPTAQDAASEPPEPRSSPAEAPSAVADAPGPAVRPREARRLAAASTDEALRRQDEAASDPAGRGDPRLEDEVADAVAFVRGSTANAPQAEGRLTFKLVERGHGPAVIEQALARSRAAGLVDDAAMAAALVEEGRRKGHAATRLRSDLRRRELAEDVIEKALASVHQEDPEAAAFAVARDKAATLTGVSAETAFRRVVGHLARRGHSEALARKVARSAVFDTRDPERTAGR